MPQGFTYTTQDIIEILPDYNTGHTSVAGVLAAPGWVAFGGFQPESTQNISLRATGGVSGPGLTLSVRVYKLTAPAGQVGPSISINSEEIVSFTSGTSFDIVGGVEYQIQAQTVGGDAEEDFGIVHSVELV